MAFMGLGGHMDVVSATPQSVAFLLASPTATVIQMPPPVGTAGAQQRSPWDQHGIAIPVPLCTMAMTPMRMVPVRLHAGGVPAVQGDVAGAARAGTRQSDRQELLHAALPAHPPGSWAAKRRRPRGSEREASGPKLAQRSDRQEQLRAALPAHPPGSWAAQRGCSKGSSEREESCPALTCDVRFVAPEWRSTEKLCQSGGGSGGVTTLTINHIPIHLGKKELLALLDGTGFIGRYDYFYLPCNYKEGTNRGHAFVNFCTPQDAQHFFASWHGARLFSGVANGDGSLLSICVCKEQGFAACAARWTALRLRRLKSADFSPAIRSQ